MTTSSRESFGVVRQGPRASGSQVREWRHLEISALGRAAGSSQHPPKRRNERARKGPLILYLLRPLSHQGDFGRGALGEPSSPLHPLLRCDQSIRGPRSRTCSAMGLRGDLAVARTSRSADANAASSSSSIPS